MTTSVTPAASDNATPGALKYPVTPEAAHAMEVSLRGCDELLIIAEWEQELIKSATTGVPLRIKLDPDPTAPDIHIDHTVVLNKMCQSQDLGHQVIFLIDDFMSAIGDPSDRNATRPPLTHGQVKANVQTYYRQTSMVLDPSKTEIRYNSGWCGPLGARGIIQLIAKYTVTHTMERDDFTKRYKAGMPISMHESLYPLMQGCDSVTLKSDLELGGADQKFNLLVGRELQKGYGQEPQCILTMPLLVGLDGVEKMPKSKGSYVGISEAPSGVFGKLMSISDNLMWTYYTLLSFRPLAEIDLMRQEIMLGHNPCDYRVMLVQEIVARSRSQAGVERTLEDFNHRTRGGVPGDAPQIELSGAPLGTAQLLKQAGLCPSTSDANHNIEQSGAKIDGTIISDKGLKVDTGTFMVQVGERHFARVMLK